MFKKAKFYSLLLIIVASTVVGLFGAPQTVNAQASEYDTRGFDAAEVVDALKINLYRQVVATCIASNERNGDKTFKGGDLTSLNWVDLSGNNDKGYKAYVTNFIDAGGDGVLSCGEGKTIVAGLLSKLGKTTTNGAALTYACELFVETEKHDGCPSAGATDSTNYKQRVETLVDWSDDKGNAKRRSFDEAFGNLTRVIDGWGYSFMTDDLGFGLGPVQNYILYKTALFEQCSAKYETMLTAGNNSSSVGNTTLKIVNEKGEIKDVRYTIDQDHKLEARVGAISYFEGPKCSEVASTMNGYAEAYATWLGGNQGGEDAGLGGGADFGEGGESASTCRVDGIGWLICPISNSIAKGIDEIFNLLKIFLIVEPISTNTDSGTYTAWSTFRNYANVIFVILFLVVIYTQITGGGVSNYTLKKMVPRLVVGAILVNTSYWICAAAVDISNLLGSSLQDFFMGVRASAVGENAEIPTWDIVTTSILTGTLVSWVGWGALVSAGGLTNLLWGLLPLLATAALSLFIAFVVLAARQALITILIVLAPIAFAAFILPNTQKWFDRWKDLFMVLLIMFPIMSVVFGGSQLAASIIMNSATNMMTVLLALGVQVIPLAITPLVLKFSGGLLSRVAAFVNNPSKGPIDGARKYAEERQDLGRKEAIGSDRPAFFARRLQGRENRRRKRLERGSTADLAGDARYEEYANTDDEVIELRRRTKELESRKQTATDISQTTVSGLLSGDPSSQAILAASEEAKLNRKTAEDNLESVVAPLVSGVARVEAAEAEINKQGVQDSVEAGVRRGMSATVVAQAETSKLEKQAAENNLTERMSPLVSQAARVGARESEISKQMAEDTASAQTARNVSTTLANRAKDAELNKKAAEDNLSAGAQGSTAARTAAKNAEYSKQIAEDNASADTSANISAALVGQAKRAAIEKQAAENTSSAAGQDELNNSVAGRDALTRAKNAELNKQISEARSETHAIDSADNELQVRAKVAAEERSNAEGRSNQTYEEAVAGEADPSISIGTIAAARSAREAAKVVAGATESAKRVSESGISDKMLKDSTFATQVGGIDPDGALRQQARAASAESRAHNENVTNNATLLEHERVSSADLAKIIEDPSQSTERQEAAAIVTIKNGGDKDIMKMIDYVGKAAKANPSDPAIISLQQQIGEHLGSRKPGALGEGDMAALRNGTFTSTVDEGWVSRAQGGKFGGANTASMSKDHLESLRDALKGHMATAPGGVPDPALAEMSRSITAFLTSPQNEGKLPPEEITNLMKEVAAVTAQPPVHGPPVPPPPSPPPPPPPPLTPSPDDV